MTRQLAELMEQANTVRGDPVCGRYAPSPTGDLHLGNLRTALTAWLQARLMDGVFILRMEDLDRPRNKAGSAEKIVHDLRVIGLDWDEGPDNGGLLGPYTQLERNDLYQAAFERLRDNDSLFPCFCSRKDIREAASAPHGDTVVYPGTCRNLRRKSAEIGQAGTPAWRFAVDEGESRFHDCLQGIYRRDMVKEVGDFVVKRRDKLFAYQLAVVVDDALMGVTDVVRGQDLIDSTPRQIALQKVLGLPTPRYWHVPVLKDDQGRRMSKRVGSVSLDRYCSAGGTVESLIGRFASDLCLADSDEPLSAAELLSGLDRTALLRMRQRSAD